MEKYQKPIMLAAALAVIAVIVWAVMTVPEPLEKSDEAEHGTVISYDGNELSEEKNGRKIWDLTAEHIDVDIEKKMTMLTKLTGHFYAEDGRVTEFKADEGRYDEQTRDVVVSGNVVVSNSDGAKLTSRELVWHAKEEILTAKGEARITKEDMLAEGDQIESRDGFNKIKVSGKAHLVKGGKSE